MTSASTQADVIIVGAGPVGLLLACELGIRGVSVILVEEQAGIVPHPRANTQSARSMEIYRRHGLSSKLRQQGLPRHRKTDVGYFVRLFDRELFRVSLPSPSDAEATVRTGDQRWPTPEPQFRISQMEIEPILLERAREFRSVHIRFDCKAAAVAQDEHLVRLTVSKGGSKTNEVLSASYLVGCDGGRSFVRASLGIRLLGDSGLEMDFMGGRMLATHFRAPNLMSKFPHADTWMNWIMHPAARSIILPINIASGEFLMHFQLADEAKIENVDFASRLADAVGTTVPHHVISMKEWRAGIGLVAKRYRERRVFIAGDAAHLFTPTGGFGMNTGIEDAFNLAWKLAMVCQGRAPAALLDSYEQERQPVGRRNARHALQLAERNGACPVSNALDEEGDVGDAARAATTRHLALFARNEFDTPGVQLGVRYDHSAIVQKSDERPPVDAPTEYVPSGVPGGRLPHVWLSGGESLFDKLGPEFTLLRLKTINAAGSWKEAARSAGVTLTVLDVQESDALKALIGDECVLVRPDQHIAWRGKSNVANPERILHAAVGGGW